jgi:hypothetical protein
MAPCLEILRARARTTTGAYGGAADENTPSCVASATRAARAIGVGRAAGLCGIGAFECPLVEHRAGGNECRKGRWDQRDGGGARLGGSAARRCERCGTEHGCGLSAGLRPRTGRGGPSHTSMRVAVSRQYPCLLSGAMSDARGACAAWLTDSTIHLVRRHIATDFCQLSSSPTQRKDSLHSTCT